MSQYQKIDTLDAFAGLKLTQRFLENIQIPILTLQQKNI